MTKLSVEGEPGVKIVLSAPLEHDGRFPTGGTALSSKAPKLLQCGGCTTPVTEVNPVCETIVHPSELTVPPMVLMAPLGSLTVTEHPADGDWLVVCPGHSYNRVPATAVMLNVSVAAVHVLAPVNV